MSANDAISLAQAGDTGFGMLGLRRSDGASVLVFVLAQAFPSCVTRELLDRGHCQLPAAAVRSRSRPAAVASASRRAGRWAPRCCMGRVALAGGDGCNGSAAGVSPAAMAHQYPARGRSADRLWLRALASCVSRSAGYWSGAMSRWLRCFVGAPGASAPQVRLLHDTHDRCSLGGLAIFVIVQLFNAIGALAASPLAVPAEVIEWSACPAHLHGIVLDRDCCCWPWRCSRSPVRSASCTCAWPRRAR